jgi:hypothetical protein
MPLTKSAIAAVAVALAAAAGAKEPADYLPQGHRIEKEAKGDLNKDGAEDAALLISDGKADCPQYSIIILYRKGENYPAA